MDLYYVHTTHVCTMYLLQILNAPNISALFAYDPCNTVEYNVHECICRYLHLFHRQGQIRFVESPKDLLNETNISAFCAYNPFTFVKCTGRNICRYMHSEITILTRWSLYGKSVKNIRTLPFKL